jgi:hypothetical protein
MTIKGWLADRLLKVIRAYFSGRTVHWMTRLDGQPLHRAEGKVISARIDRGAYGDPVGMTFFWNMPGRPLHEMKRFPISTIEWDKTLGWVFYGD